MKLLRTRGLRWITRPLLRAHQWRLGRLSARSQSIVPTLRWLDALAADERHVEVSRGALLGLERWPFSPDLERCFVAAWQAGAEDEELDQLTLGRGGAAGLERARAAVKLLIQLEDYDAAERVLHCVRLRGRGKVECRLLEGEVLLARYLRQRRVKDGQAVIKAFEAAITADNDAFDGHYGLAKICFEIGATSKANFHALLASELDPSHLPTQKILVRLKSMPIVRTPLDKLLWAAEVHDESSAPQASGAQDPELLSAMKRGLASLSTGAGVQRAALRNRDRAWVAREGQTQRPTGVDGRFLDLAEGLRREGSKMMKRLDFGRLEHVAVDTQEGHLLAVTAGPSVMVFATDEGTDTKALELDARRKLADWNAAAEKVLA